MRLAWTLLVSWLLFPISSAAMPAHSHDHSSVTGFYGPYPMSREASGTAWQPDSTPHEGIHVVAGEWMLRFHGYAYGIYDHQGSDRGRDKWFSANMLMTMAQRPLGPGTLGFRNMLSLEPAMGKEGYPLLLQTGETADGHEHLIDRQHPHDLFMELAATYSVPVREDQSVFAYFGLPGEPALGPAAFMHRVSGLDNPQAPITHHWLDSTHITYGVATLGYVWGGWKLEGSTFKGREPDQYRWDIEKPKFDSYSGRVSFNPSRNWAMQMSYGYLESSEQLTPEVNQHRLTASAAYNKAFNKANWGTTFAWGQNNNTTGHRLDGYLLESAYVYEHKRTLFGRLERVEKDELFEHHDPLGDVTFTVHQASLGYIRDFRLAAHAALGLGALGTVSFLPAALESAYGKKNPLSFMLFVRAKIL
jgi:hypothetical protein